MTKVMTRVLHQDKYGSDGSQGKYEFRGKRRGDTIAEW
jgi:hypothetical protein